MLTTILVLALSFATGPDVAAAPPGSLPPEAVQPTLTTPDVPVATSAAALCISGPADHLDACAQVVLDAIVNKQWGLLASFALLFIIAALRKWTPEASKFGLWIRSKLGAIIMNFALALALGFATQFLAGIPFSAAVVLKALSIALGASGGWAILKNVREAVIEKKAQAAGVDAATKPTDTLNS